MINTCWRDLWHQATLDTLNIEELDMPNYVFKNEARSGYYYGWYRDSKGNQRQFSCKTKNKREAERYYHNKLVVLLKKEAESHNPSTSLSDFRLNFIQFCESANPSYSPATTLASDYALRMLLKDCGDRSLSEYSVEDCQKFVYTYPASVSTRRKLYAHLRSAFQFAVEWKKIESNPFAKFKKPREVEVQWDILTKEEFDFFISTIPTDTYSQRRSMRIYILAFETGMRLSEILHLERTDLVLEKNILYVQNKSDWTTKGKCNRPIYLSERAKQCLIEQLNDNQASVPNCSFLFPNLDGKVLRKDTVSREFKKLITRAFPDRPLLHFHSLRHSFGTKIGTAPGISQAELQQYLGHSSQTMTNRYIHPRAGSYSTLILSINT
jgi:integrase